MAVSQTASILEFARQQHLLSGADMRAHGWSPQLLVKLEKSGKLQRVARGLYSLPDTEVTEHQSLAEVCRQVPKAVICLLSALQFHEIGTQLPFEVWIALPEGTPTPALAFPTLRVSRLRGEAYTEGVETVTEHGSDIRVYNIEKTITDCFKLRSKVGLDVALEALKSAWQLRKLNMNQLNHFARINRVTKVMQPYLEAVVA